MGVAERTARKYLMADAAIEQQRSQERQRKRKQRAYRRIDPRLLMSLMQMGLSRAEAADIIGCSRAAIDLRMAKWTEGEHAQSRRRPKWTAALIKIGLRRQAETMGYRPTSSNQTAPDRPPYKQAVRAFGSWQAALEAAGVADYPTRIEWTVKRTGELLDEGLDTDEIARRLDTSRDSIISLMYAHEKGVRQRREASAAEAEKAFGLLGYFT